jgi:hypothetical protein
MPGFTIHKMTALRQPIILKDQAIIAHMAVDYGSIRLAAVNLVVNAKSEFRVALPSYGRSRVILTDKDERQQLLRSALSAYRALTGCEIAETPVAKAPVMDTQDDHSRDAGAPGGDCCRDALSE